MRSFFKGECGDGKGEGNVRAWYDEQVEPLVKCRTKIRKPILISYNKKTLCQKVS